MEIQKVCNLINQELAGELLSKDELFIYIDKIIDNINTQLNSCYPTFSEYTSTLFSDYPNYNVFPDKYLRSVVVPGSVYEFYKVDEEGNNTAPQFLKEYQTNLYYMVRDMIEQVPCKFRARSQGFVYSDEDTVENINMQNILD